MNSVDRFMKFSLYVIISATMLNGSLTSQTGRTNAKAQGIADILKDTAIQQAEAAGSLMQLFERFMIEYDKSYASLAEKMIRLDIFQKNLKKIENLMANRKGNVVFGVNEFADLTSEEFMQRYTGLTIPENVLEATKKSEHRRDLNETKPESKRSSSMPPTNSSSSPTAKRQKTSDDVTFSQSPSTSPPKLPSSPVEANRTAGEKPSGPTTPARGSNPNQNYPPSNNAGLWPAPTVLMKNNVFFGDPKKYPRAETTQRGALTFDACWAFASATAVEILNVQQNGQLHLLSKQHSFVWAELIDCYEGRRGKTGRGNIMVALNFIVETGLTSADAYPYMAKYGVCNSTVQPVVKLKGYELIKRESLITEALLTSPVPTGLFHGPDFQFYRAGVYNPPDCKRDLKQLNHASVIVGQNNESWTLLNNFGPRWGMKGYFLLKKGRGGIGMHSFSLSL